MGMIFPSNPAFFSSSVSMSFFEFLSSFSLPGTARTHSAPPFAGRKHRTLSLIFYIRTVRTNSGHSFARSKTANLRSLFSSLGPTSLFVGPRLSKTSENTFYKHTKIAFIRRISNFGPNKITRSCKIFHRTHHFRLFSAVLTTSKKFPGKVSGNFKAVRTNFIYRNPFTTASTTGKIHYRKSIHSYPA